MAIPVLICFIALILFLILLFGIPIIIIVKSTNKKQNAAQINTIESYLVKYCSNCGAEINPKAIVCLSCGCAINQHKQFDNSQDTPSVGLNILSFFFPIIGLILYIVKNDNKPTEAKDCGKWALIGFVLNLFFTPFFSALLFSL